MVSGWLIYCRVNWSCGFFGEFLAILGMFGRSVLRCNRLHLPRWQLMRLVMDTPSEATHQHKLPKKYQLLLKAFLLTNIRLLAVLFFRWQCCWWLQRKKARMVSMVGCNEKMVVAFFLKPGNPSRPFKEIGFHQPKTFFLVGNQTNSFL